jgi:predicted kinase
MVDLPESPPVPPAAFGLRLPRPVVVALIGLPGAGKSVVAAHLHQRLQVRVVDRDAIRRALFPECAYSQPEKRASVHAAFLAVEVNSALGESTVVDGMTFSKTRDLARLGDLVKRYGLGFVPVWLDLPAEVARARIQSDIDTGSQHPAEDRVPEIVDAVLAGFQRPPRSVPVVDATLPAERVCALVEHIVVAAARRH